MWMGLKTSIAQGERRRVGRNGVGIKEAFENGRRAFENGKKFTACTYRDADKVEAWERGWQAALTARTNERSH